MSTPNAKLAVSKLENPQWKTRVDFLDGTIDKADSEVYSGPDQGLNLALTVRADCRPDE